jgi:hypothetical protein
MVPPVGLKSADSLATVGIYETVSRPARGSGFQVVGRV